jgi:signal transduction histidine kinase
MNRALRFRRRLGGTGAAVLVILFLVFFLVFRSGTESAEMSGWVAHTQDVLGVIAHARLERARLENETWGYFWMRDSQFPELFQEDRRRLTEDMHRLRALTSDNSAQQKLLDDLAPILTAHVDSLDQAMRRSEAAPTSNLPSSPIPLKTGQVVRRIWDLFERLESNERTLLVQRSRAFQKNATETQAVILAAGFFTLSVFLIGGYLIQREILLRARIETGLRHAQELLGGEYESQRSELGHTMEDLHAQIRARQQAEDEIHHLNEELEARVEKRTTELLEANRELEAFTYSVSHDLRAPLRHMDGFSRILQQEYGPQLPEEARHYLDRVRSATTQMSSLVEDLLHLSHTGRQVPQRRIICLNALLEEAKAEVLPEAGNRTIHWEAAALPRVEADPVLLRQVFSNLLSNAIKFTRQVSRPVIEIGSREDETGIVIFVRDNGAGFDPRFADKLFGVFQRLHRQDEFEGTGIGLATVQRIVHKHGGRVWAESQVGQGAIFYFSLPGRAKNQRQIPEVIGASA